MAEKTHNIRVSRMEARFYEHLYDLASGEHPLQFDWQVLNSRPIDQGSASAVWLVPSASTEGVFHKVDVEVRIWDCDGWRFKHTCSHLRVADRAAGYFLAKPITRFAPAFAGAREVR